MELNHKLNAEITKLREALNELKINYYHEVSDTEILFRIPVKAAER